VSGPLFFLCFLLPRSTFSSSSRRQAAERELKEKNLKQRREFVESVVVQGKNFKEHHRNYTLKVTGY